jgi:tetratricopeptide (TPR) repeat protein
LKITKEFFIWGVKMDFYKSKVIVLLAVLMLSCCFAPEPIMVSPLDARPRIMAGSETEKKMKKKVKSLLNKARKLSKKGQIKESIDMYWKIMEIDSNAAAAYLELGSIYSDLKLNDRAIELLEPGLELLENEYENPETMSEFYCLLTMLYFEKKELGKASQTLIKAAKKAPASPAPRKILGDIYLSRGRVKDAIKAYKKAVELDPDYQPAIKKLGEIAKENKFASETPRKRKIATPKKESPVLKARPIPVKKKTPPLKAKIIENNAEVPISTEVIIPVKASKVQTKLSQPESKESPTPTPTPTPMPASKPEPELQERPTPMDTIANSTSQPTNLVVDERDIELAETLKAKKEFKGNIDTVIDKLLIGNLQEKAEATEKLISLEDKGLHALEDLLYDSDPDVRIIAIRSLSKFSAHKNRVKIILQDSIDDPDPEVKKVLQSTLEGL